MQLEYCVGIHKLKYCIAMSCEGYYCSHRYDVLLDLLMTPLCLLLMYWRLQLQAQPTMKSFTLQQLTHQQTFLPNDTSMP